MTLPHVGHILGGVLENIPVRPVVIGEAGVIPGCIGCIGCIPGVTLGLTIGVL